MKQSHVSTEGVASLVREIKEVKGKTQILKAQNKMLEKALKQLNS